MINLFNIIKYYIDTLDPITGLKEITNEKTPKTYTQQQNDMTMLYGRLDYIVNQLNQLQNTCSQK